MNQVITHEVIGNKMPNSGDRDNEKEPVEPMSPPLSVKQ